MKNEEWYLVLIEVIFVAVLNFFMSLGFVALGWNLLLTKVFVSVPVLDFKELCMLTIAINFIATPATIGASHVRNKILKAVRGEK